MIKINKKIISIFTMFVFTVLLMFSSITYGVQGESKMPEQNNMAENMNGNSPVVVQEIQERERVINRTQLNEEELLQLKERFNEREQVMVQELNNYSTQEKKVYENQNKVRLAVQNLLELGNYSGNFGENISQVAREYNNSVQSTIQIEEKIQTRSLLQRFLSGGDSESAQEMLGQVNKNQEKIQLLNQYEENCDCDEEVREMIREQVSLMEEEQTRLRDLANSELSSKGLFGWIWK